MVATLVVSLPSVHTGGELVVDDGGKQRTFRGSRDDLVLVAFYADRRHEVKPVACMSSGLDGRAHPSAAARSCR